MVGHDSGEMYLAYTTIEGQPMVKVDAFRGVMRRARSSGVRGAVEVRHENSAAFLSQMRTSVQHGD